MRVPDPQERTSSATASFRRDHPQVAATAGVLSKDEFQTQGINMLNYERHLIVVTVICLVIIAVAVVAVILEVPLPLIGEK